MKTFKIPTRAAVAFGLAVAMLSALTMPLSQPVQADEWPFGRVGALVPVSGALSDNTDTALLIRYVGTGSGKVAVAANGDLTFTDGTEGAEAANTDFECPVSGALGGIIDVSDAACDTLGEVVDTINGACSTCTGTATKWRAVILDGKRADSSNDTLLTIAATAATASTGLALKWDTAVAFKSTIALTPYRDILAYIENRNNQMIQNPFVGRRASFIIGNATSTFGSGTSTFSVENCAVSNKLGVNGSETCTTLYSVAGGATTVNKVFDYTPYGIIGRQDEKLLVRLTNSAAMSSTAHYAYGMSWFYR